MLSNMNIEIFEEILICYENSNEILYNLKKILTLNISKFELLEKEHNKLVTGLESFKNRIEVLNIEKIDLNNKILNPNVLSTEKNSLKDELNYLRIEINSLENNKLLLKSQFEEKSKVINICDVIVLDSYLDDQLEDLNKKFKVLKEHYDEINPNKTEMDLDDNLNELCYKSYELLTLEKKITPTLVDILKASTEIDDLLELTDIEIIKSFYNDKMTIDDIQKFFESYNIQEVIDLDLDIPDEHILNMDFKYE